MLQLKKFPDIPISTREEARKFRPHPEVPRFRLLLERRDLSLRGGERIPRVPVAFQEEALSTGKARGTPGSCHHSQSPPDVSVHSRETCFPSTASTFKPRIDSHHSGKWDSPVGKPRGKASWESHRDPLWWPQERTVPMQVAQGPLGIPLPSMPGPKALWGVGAGT